MKDLTEPAGGESWRVVWREGFAPVLPTAGLQALARALRADDARLSQGSTTTPPPLMVVQDWDVEAACAVGFCGWVAIEAKLNNDPISVKPYDAVEIPLTNGKVAWVSPEDYDGISRYSWWAQEHHGRWYAHRTEYVGGNGYKKFNVPMHRQIMSAATGTIIDHIDRNGLNNHRNNLRLTSDAENKRNCRRTGASHFRGVYPSATKGKWCAKLSDRGKSVYLGTFDTEREAAKTYNRESTERFGIAAALNKFATVGQVEEFFAKACFEADQRLGEPAACRFFLNAWDETPRGEMFRELLPEVEYELARRAAG